MTDLDLNSISVRDAQKRAAKAQGVRALNPNFDPAKASWSELHEERKSARKILRAFMDDGTAEGNEAVFNAVDEHAEMLGDEMDERDAAGSREPLKADPRRPIGTDGSCRGDSGDFHPDQRDDTFGLTREQRFADHSAIRASAGQEHAGLGLGTYLRSMVRGAKTDAEKRALSEGSDSAGGFSVPSVLSAQLIDRLRARNVAIQAGARTIPITSDRQTIARVAGDPTPGWKAENAQQSETDVTFDNVVFEPKTLMVLVRASRELLEDSLNVETELPNVIAAAMANELDRVAFMGSGSGSEPLGLDGIAGVQELDHGSAAISDYSVFTQARRRLLDENTETIGPWIMAPQIEEDIANLTDANGQPLNPPNVLSPFNTLTSSKFPTDLGAGNDEGTVYGGDMTQVAIGIRNDIRVEVLRERYADFHQYGFVAYLRADIATIQPKSVIRITGVTT